MKIAIFTDSFFPYLSGATTAIRNRAKGLIARGHEVAVFRPTANSEIKAELPEQLEVYDLPISIPAKGFEDLNIEIPLFLPAYKAARKFESDIIHVDTEGGMGWQGIFSAKVMGKPLVTTPHTFWADEEYLEYLPLSNKDFKQTAAWKCMLLFHARADLVIPPSRLMKNEFKSRNFEGDVKVIPNSILEVELKKEQFINQKREEYGLESGPNLIFVGRVSHEKSLGRALKAFKEIAASFSDSNFVIIGEGDAEEDLKEKVKEWGLTERVKFLGFVSNEKLMKENLYRLGDIFVTASKSEDFPVSLLEAQQFGLPIIAPKAGGISEIVTDQKDGLLYSSKTENQVERMGKLLKKLMKNENKREKMSRKALGNSEKYKIKEVTQKLERTYQSLIS